MYVSGDEEFDTLTVLFAAYAATATGRRGCGGSLLTDKALAQHLNLSARTLERARAKMVDIGHCVVDRAGRRLFKHVRKRAGEAFVIVPAIGVRALLNRHIGIVAFKVFGTAINHRIESGPNAGCWRGVGWLAKKLRRSEKTIAAAIDELLEAGLVRLDEFGNGLPRRLEPQFARPVTQRLSKKVRDARDWIHRRVGLRTTPPSGVGSAPPSGVGYEARPRGSNAQVRPDAVGSNPVRDLYGSDLDVPELTRAERDRSAPWLLEMLARNTRVIRT